ncbi:MAG: hypothetical protein OXE57_13035 [Alphaproteobacteria bacterium]|nr:hypothetical protein [Alphaproteobacteria bacterium]
MICDHRWHITLDAANTQERVCRDCGRTEKRWNLSDVRARSPHAWSPWKGTLRNRNTLEARKYDDALRASLIPKE